jgi:hypothetical protein
MGKVSGVCVCLCACGVFVRVCVLFMLSSIPRLTCSSCFSYALFPPPPFSAYLGHPMKPHRISLTNALVTTCTLSLFASCVLCHMVVGK